MKELADGVWHLNTITLPNAVNAYLIGDVLVDAGGRRSGARILRQLEGHDRQRPRAHPRAPRPPGGEPRDLRELGIPFWVGRGRRRRRRGPNLIGRASPTSR